MPKKKKGGKKGGDAGAPGDYPITKNKEALVEKKCAEQTSRFISLQAELVARNDEVSRAQAELQIAQAKRDAARSQAQGMEGDVVSVQRDFARLFKVRFHLSQRQALPRH